jgi:hypothetical protein
MSIPYKGFLFSAYLNFSTYLMNTTTEVFKQHVDKKLSTRMKMYFFISLVMIGIVVYELVITDINPLIVVGIFLASVGFGFLMSRMFHISWNEDDQVVTSRIDKIGGIMLGVYMIFSFSRHFLLESYVRHSWVTIITFTTISGVMVGRLLGMGRRIFNVIKEQDLPNLPQ